MMMIVRSSTVSRSLSTHSTSVLQSASSSSSLIHCGQDVCASRTF